MEQPSTSSGQSCEQTNPLRRFRRTINESDRDDEGRGHISYAESDKSSHSPHLSDESESNVKHIQTHDTDVQKGEVNKGDYVLVMYENQLFPGQVKEVASNTALILAMKK